MSSTMSSTQVVSKVSKVSMEVVTMLSTKYEFDVEEALKYVEENVKIVEKKGRPKKEKKVVEVSGKVDIFTTLVEGAECENKVEDAPKKMTKKAEKEAKKAEKEAKKTEKEAEKEAKIEAKAQKAAEKEAKAQKEKKPRTEAQIAAFEKMKAKGEEKRKQKALEKEQGVAPVAEPAEPATPVTEPVAEVAAKVAAEVAAEVAAPVKAKAAKTKKTKVVEEAKEEVKVKKFELNGKKYLKSSENILYDAETQEVIGKWNEEKKEIVFEELEEEEDQE